MTRPIMITYDRCSIHFPPDQRSDYIHVFGNKQYREAMSVPTFSSEQEPSPYCELGIDTEPCIVIPDRQLFCRATWIHELAHMYQWFYAPDRMEATFYQNPEWLEIFADAAIFRLAKRKPSNGLLEYTYRLATTKAGQAAQSYEAVNGFNSMSAMCDELLVRCDD